VAVWQQPKILPPNVRQIASDDGLEEPEEIRHRISRLVLSARKKRPP
jgi:hypothetical protein